ncbi:hypothetical protein Q7P37_006656 [Cladosporium fusiforme]
MDLRISYDQTDRNTYFNNPELSDLKIELTDRTIHAHKVILCNNSDYFKVLLNGRFMESTHKEVKLHEDNPDAMVAMFRAMYGLPYLSRDIEEGLSNEDLLEHAQVYIVADKYQLPVLKRLVVSNLQTIMNAGDDQQKSNLAEALRVLFTGIDTGGEDARKTLVEHCARVFSLRYEGDDLNAVKDLMSELPEVDDAITTHPDYDLGSWECEGDDSCHGDPSCSDCHKILDKHEVWENRRLEAFTCECKRQGLKKAVKKWKDDNCPGVTSLRSPQNFTLSHPKHPTLSCTHHTHDLTTRNLNMHASSDSSNMWMIKLQLHQGVALSEENSYFNDPTFSDLDIVLSDRRVHVHRLILCCASEYFRKLLMGPFLESAAKEIQFHEDDPDAMFAMLRFIYGLPYLNGEEYENFDGSTASRQQGNEYVCETRQDIIVQHTQVYVIADKYQLPKLQDTVQQNISKILAALPFHRAEPSIALALRICFTQIAHDEDGVRSAMLNYCAMRVSSLKEEKLFRELLSEFPELAVAILQHDAFDTGVWCCDGDSDCTGTPSCGRCGHIFTADYAMDMRHFSKWLCPEGICEDEEETEPLCSDCDKPIRWRPQNHAT